MLVSVTVSHVGPSLCCCEVGVGGRGRTGTDGRRGGGDEEQGFIAYACQVRVTVGDSGLCCCVCVTSFEC